MGYYNPNTDSANLITGETLTTPDIPEAITEAIEFVDQDCTFTITLHPPHIFRQINHTLNGDNKINGVVKGVTEGKIVLDITKHPDQINNEHFNGFTSIGHEFWLSNYGAEAVLDVHVEDNKIKATMLNEGKVLRALGDKLKPLNPTLYFDLRQEKIKESRVEIIKHLINNTDKFDIPTTTPKPDNSDNTQQNSEEDTNEYGIPKDHTTKYKV